MISAGFLVMFAAQPAAATIVEGNCTGTANGQLLSVNSADNPLIVREHTSIQLAGKVFGEKATAANVKLHYFGIGFAGLHELSVNGTTWSGSVPVDKYASYGVGDYVAIIAIRGTGVDAEGLANNVCYGALYLKVKGNPLSTLAGDVALGLEVAGVAGLAASGVSASRGPRAPEGFEAIDDEELAPPDVLEDLSQIARAKDTAELAEEQRTRDAKAQELVALLGNKMCTALILPGLFLLMAAPMTGGGASKRPRARGRLRLSFIGLVSGLIAGVSAVVLLAQYGVLFPTRNMGIVGIAGGLVAGVLIPSLGRARAVRKVNRRIDALYSN